MKRSFEDPKISFPKFLKTGKQSKLSPNTPAVRLTDKLTVSSTKINKEEHVDKRDRSGLPKEYDPYINRDVRQPLTYRQAFIHLIKSAFGAGILAMPQAFINYGFVTGFISTLFIGIILTHALQILIRSEYKLCQRTQVPKMTYSEVSMNCFKTAPQRFRKLAYAAGLVTDFYICVYQLGICWIYIVFVGVTLQKIMNPVLKLPLVVWQTAALIPLCAIICIRNLKNLALLSGIANGMIIAGLSILTYFLVTNEETGKDLVLWGNIKTFPLAFGTTLFAFTVFGTVMYIENEMKNPEQMTAPFGVLNMGMVVVVPVYLAIGVFGYVYCVSKCQDLIVFDLPTNRVTIVTQALYGLAILLSYPLNAYPATEIIWGSYVKPNLEKKGKTKLWPYEYATRFFLCFLTFALGTTAPRLEDLISLFGAFCLSCLGFIFPAIIQLIVYTPNYGKYNYMIYKNVILCIIGFVGMIAGSASATAKIVKSFQ